MRKNSAESLSKANYFTGRGMAHERPYIIISDKDRKMNII